MEEDKSNVVQNQPYDETVEVSDGEEIPSNNHAHRSKELKAKQSFLDFSKPGVSQHGSAGRGKDQGRVGKGGRSGGDAAAGGGETEGFHEEDNEESDPSGSEESEESGEQAPLAGVYDPSEFSHLPVSKDISELFKHITRYKPQTVQLETKLKPFIPEFIPAIGDIDAFLKVSVPNNSTEILGLTLLDEPKVDQSDATLLDLTLRTVSKHTSVKPMVVRSIEDPEKQIKEMDAWTNNISKLHRQKPATIVLYTKSMPSLESLMQEWPSKFQDALRDVVFLPSADMNCDLAQFADIICALMDIPVYNRIHSLHMLFSLYMEFKNSQYLHAASVEVLSENLTEEKCLEVTFTLEWLRVVLCLTIYNWWTFPPRLKK